MVVLSVFNGIVLLLRIDRKPDTLRTSLWQHCDTLTTEPVLLFFAIVFFFNRGSLSLIWLAFVLFVDTFHLLVCGASSISSSRVSHLSVVVNLANHEWDESVKKWDVVRELVWNLTRVRIFLLLLPIWILSSLMSLAIYVWPSWIKKI